MGARGVEFGLLLHTRHLIRGDHGPQGVEEFFEGGRQAEAAGFDHLWVGDGPRISLLDRAHADCLTIMAALAAKTSKIRIGVVPLIAALRNPVLLAHSLATLDVISSSRILFGVSVAPQYKHAEIEFEGCGVPFKERAGRLDECIQLMRRLWSEDSFAFEGKYYRFDGGGIQPKPLRKTIPIWVAAGDNERALRRVARLGDGWFTVAHSLDEFVGRRRKIEQFDQEFGRGGRELPSTLFATFHLEPDARNAEEEGWSLAERYFHQPRAALRHLNPFFGTPEECAAKLQGYVDAGLTAVVARLISPDVAGQMRLLLDEVKPRLK
jgi:alkanesulfonate monooxygenase SsuD/methylene tetrahydromethanopterin reductase-like flavin-dependent oxidoreductase (luciferase family)